MITSPATAGWWVNRLVRFSLVMAVVMEGSCSGMADAASTDGGKAPLLKITPKSKTDTVQIDAGKEGVIISIHSPAGISQACIERSGESWPLPMVLRLHLKGLENFRAGNGKSTVNAAVSSGGNKHQVRLWKSGEENTPLDATSPFWMDIRMICGDGIPAKSIPLKDGYFEMRLPKALFEGNPKSITLAWIDFYRG